MEAWIMNNVLIIGDSIMSVEFSQDMTDRIASDLSRKLIRDTIGGSTIAPLNEVGIVDHIKNGLYARIKKENPHIDLVLIQRGVNDIARVKAGLYPLGTKEKEDEVSMYGSTIFCMKYLKKLFPQARIIWGSIYFNPFTPHADVADLNSYLQEQCQKNGLGFFDLAALCWKDEKEAEKYLADGLHPNRLGCQRLEECWKKCL
jgi:lysophospholipase L1-like esterase